MASILSEQVFKTVAVIYAENNNSWNTTADLDYNPVNNSSDFYGWKTADGTLLGKNADITDLVAAAVTTALYPDCRTGSWITFNENDKWTNADGLEVNIHATYRAPAFIEQDGEIDISNSQYDVSAEGYTFDGWYDAAEGGNKLSTVTEGKTVYAHWTAKDNIEYKVAYWQQNANDDGYSLVANDIETKTGTAGEEATYDSEAIQNKYQYFHLNTDLSDAAKERVVIAGDGSTIRNVYFDRNEFTLTFKGYITYTYEATTYSNAPIGDQITNSSNINTLERNKRTKSGYDVSYYYDSYYYSNYAIKVDGVWYRITSNGSYVYSNYTTSISFPGVKIITAKYEENISSNFPIAGYTGYVWEPQNSSVYTTGDVPFIENMKPENTVFQAKTYGSGTTIHFYYYTEATGREGSDVTKVTYGGMTYVEHQHVQISSSGDITSTENEDFIDIEGYKHNGSNPSYGSDGKVSINSSNNYTMKFYYARKTYNLEFNSNGSTVHRTTALYQEALNGKAPENFKIGETTRKDSSGKILIFQGWYDNADFAGNAYNFAESYMPSNDLIFYAKWSPVKHRVVLNANTGKFVTDEGDVSSINFTLEDGGTVEANNPTKENYNFIGWYTDENLTQRFNPSTRVTGDVLTAPNYPVAPETDPDSAVRGKLTLYAKWRPEMDANTYIQVQYDADGGTVNGVAVYSDPLHYAAAAEAVAQPAAAPASDEAGKSFRAWQILNAADEVVGEVLPGNIFNVNLADAEETTVDGKTVYVVTLKADYAVATSTHIVWYGNGGTTADGAETVESADANLNAAIQVKPADTFTREGYVFLGWARLDEDEMKEGNSWRQADAEATAKLWLKWDGEHYTAVNDQSVTVTDPDIAANEDTPHHVLYAVWDKIENYNYVIDFNAKMKVAEEASCLKDETSKNGVFAKSKDEGTYDVTYQLNSGKQADKTAKINSAYTDVDTALVYGKPMNVAGAKIGWNQINTVPASSVYYDDSFTEENAQVLEHPGDVVAQTGTFDGSNSHIFTFYGTGIDVYCTTNDNGGYVSARVYQGNTTSGTVEGTVTVKNQSQGAYYNTPTVHFADLTPGYHTVWIYANENANYQIDGVRVYNPVKATDNGETTKAAAELAKTDEANANYFNLHDLLLNKSSDYSAISKEKYASLEAADAVAVSGVLYLDNAGKICLKSNDAQGNAQLMYESDFDLYKTNSPINEIYLQTTNGNTQGVAFQLANYPVTGANEKVYLGVSAPKGSGTVVINGHDLPVTSSVDQYYDITEWIATEGATKGVVSIKTSTSDTNLISITNLKITGVTAEAITGQNPPADAANNSNSLNSYRRLAFAPMTTATVEAIAEETVPELFAIDPETTEDPGTPVTPENPDTPDQPDDPKPVWNDGVNSVQTILKTLFQYLLNSLNSLFSGLGKW